MDMLVNAKCEQQRREAEKNRKELKSVRKRMAELEKILNKLYEDLALERINESRYQAMAPRYEAEQDELRAKETGLSQAVEQAEDTYSRIEKFVPIISQYTDISELNTYILNELIERIVVHEKTVDEDGSKSQRVDIYYKFVIPKVFWYNLIKYMDKEGFAMNIGDIVEFYRRKQFKYIKPLGDGGTGDTYLFLDETTGIHFAIKKYSPNDTVKTSG